jgi:hypothetical protein
MNGTTAFDEEKRSDYFAPEIRNLAPNAPSPRQSFPLHAD